MKKSIFLCFLMVFLGSCEEKIVEFDSKKPLESWYSETSAMAGSTYWNPVAYQLPSPEGIMVSRLTLDDSTDVDFYFPAEHDNKSHSPVIITPRIFKRADDVKMFGRGTLTMDYEISWAHLLATRGWVVVKYETDSPNTALSDVIGFVVENEKALGVNADNIGFWSISSNPKAVLAFLASSDSDQVRRISCAAFFSPDLKINAPYGFSDLHHVPYFIAIGAEDDKSMNTRAVNFVKSCKDKGLSVEFFEHPSGGHGFDALTKDDRTVEIIDACLDFFTRNL